MRKILVALLLTLTLVSPPAIAGQRVVANVCRQPYRLLNKQFASSANVFCTADPSAGGTPLTLTSATGDSSNDGTVTIALTNGFTAPVTLTCYVWIADKVTPANSGWVRLGGNSNQYSIKVDSQYTSVSFGCPERVPFIVESSAAITGNVYTDAVPDSNNYSNSPSGYAPGNAP